MISITYHALGNFNKINNLCIIRKMEPTVALLATMSSFQQKIGDMKRTEKAVNTNCLQGTRVNLSRQTLQSNYYKYVQGIKRNHVQGI